MFIKLKETMEWTNNKMQEVVRTEIRKPQTERTELKNLLSEMKTTTTTTLKDLVNIMTAIEDRMRF